MSTKQATTPAHPYAEIFPLNEGQPLWDLSDRIEANGQREPIVLLDGMILDGRRRELACIRKGIDPTYRQFGSRKTDGKDPLEFVIDMNLHRRHLGDGDRALAAAKYATAKGGGDRTTGSNGTGGPTKVEAAEKFEVSEQAVKRAKVVLANGTPALQAAVAADEITVSDAAKVAKQPAKDQDKAVAAVKSGKAKSAAAAAKPKSGKPLFDDRTVGDLIGKLTRSFDLRADVVGKCKEHKDCIEAMTGVNQAWRRWQAKK